MGNYKDILNDWNNCLSNYPKLKFQEAKDLYTELLKCKDNEKRKNMQDSLILSTLYVVFEFITNNGLIYLNSCSYDMSDIISVCNEICVNKINSGALINANSFREIFDSDFYNSIAEELNIQDYSIAENTILNANVFVDLLYDYIELNDKCGYVSYNKLLEFMKSSRKYRGIIYNLYKTIYYGYENNFYELFDAIIDSFDLEFDDLKISKTKLDKLKYIIISNGLEFLRSDISNVVAGDSADTWIKEYSREKFIDIVFKESNLTDIQKEILAKRYGIFDGKYRTLEEIAKDYGVTKERIRQREAKALRMLRKPSIAREIRNLI